MTWTFTVPLEVPSQNATDRMHWAARNKLKKRWLTAVLLNAFRIPRAEGKRSVRIMAYRKRRITDHANLVGGCKLVIDALRDSRQLIDDSDRWMVATYAQDLASHSPTGKPCTVFTIEDLPFTTSCPITTPDTGKGTP